MSNNKISEYSGQLKNMTRFLRVSIEQDKSIPADDICDFLKRIEIVADKLYTDLCKID